MDNIGITISKATRPSLNGLTGRRISREGGKAEGFDGRCRLDPRGCAALRAAQAADRIRRPIVAGAKRPRQRKAKPTAGA